jgi:hypothetical protein
MAYLKALYAAIHAGLLSAGVAYTAGHGHIGWESGIVIATSVVTAFGIVWGVPNADKPAA